MSNFQYVDTLELEQVSQTGMFDVICDDLEFWGELTEEQARVDLKQGSEMPVDIPIIENGVTYMSAETTSSENISGNTHIQKIKPTFVGVSEQGKESFVNGMKNRYTSRKTESSLRQFQRWLAERNDLRNIWEIMHTELDNFLGLFLLSIRKADGSEYESDTLTSYHRGLDRCLRENKYPYIDGTEFDTSRAVLAAKQKKLKQQGKGNRPNAAEPLSTGETDILRQKGAIETNEPDKRLSYVWLNNTTLLGIRGGTENHKLRWGDIQLKKTDAGREYLEYNERLTKTRTAEKRTEIRAFPPKQFAHATTETCTVFAYKEYARRRPLNMLLPDAPFCLQINRNRRPGTEIWYNVSQWGKTTWGV